MRTLIGLFVACLVGCASHPLITGRPGDWKGKTAEELRAGLGEPSRKVPQKDGGEIWEYLEEGDFTREHRSPGKYRIISTYLVKDGKVKKWGWVRYENGEAVDQDDG